jgi:hypothetical protein
VNQILPLSKQIRNLDDNKGVNHMELTISLYQDKADKAIDDMLHAWDRYEATHNACWLHMYLEFEVIAIRYLSLWEKARTI